MKKIFAAITALALALACVPALAFTGFDADPGMPEFTECEEAFFPVELHRVENDPLEEENDWGETVYTWNYMDDETAIAVGDTVTMSVEFSIPAAIEGYEGETLNSIQNIFRFSGILDLEVVVAYGCDVNIVCDFDAGVCYPLDGYGNVELEADTLTVDAHLDTDVQIIVRGTAVDEKIGCGNIIILGQNELPTHFSVGTLKKTDANTYYAYYKDVLAVQVRGMKFVAADGVFDHYFVCYNDHDFIRSEDGTSFTSVEDPEDVVTEGPRFDALTLAYETYMTFFGFTDDGVNDVLTDGVFLDGCAAASFAQDFRLGGETAPTPVNPPATGCMSLAALGVAAIASGASVFFFRKKEA